MLRVDGPEDERPSLAGGRRAVRSLGDRRPQRAGGVQQGAKDPRVLVGRRAGAPAAAARRRRQRVARDPAGRRRRVRRVSRTHGAGPSRLPRQRRRAARLAGPVRL